MINLFLLGFQQPVFEFDFVSGRGLNVTCQGVPIVRGSWFQYYESGWTKGYYSSRSENQQITKVDDDTVQMKFASRDGMAKGSETFHRSANALKIDYHFEWSGDRPVKVEVASGHLWAPGVEFGTVLADGVPGRDLRVLPEKADAENKRRLSRTAKDYEFSAPFMDLSVIGSVPLLAFDARNGYPQDWAEGKQVIWVGAEDLDIAGHDVLDFSVEWTVRPKAREKATSLDVRLDGQADLAAITPVEEMPTLIPKPDPNELDFSKPMHLTLNHTFPAGRFSFYDEFLTALARRFDIPKVAKTDAPIAIDGGVSRMHLIPGGYRIDIKPNSISVLGEEDEGLHMGLARLAQLAFVKNGQLMLPTGLLIDQPKIDFRGVHLFVGKDAASFQKKLWGRVLRPLGMNKVVLQCEQTKWDALDGHYTPIAMAKSDLVKLFDQYRKMSVEPIPLIQSFGHMEWLFAEKQNLDLAFNPDEPYAIDPRKPAAQAKVAQIWEEAIAALKPKWAHFGLDEVDMRGHAKHDPELVTEMWQKQLPFLGDIAKKHNLKMILWGDKALAPGEAIDAALGDNVYEAEQRRKAIPAGSYIGDWHYKADPRPERFYKTLQLWKSNGMKPIATAWYRPENIRGFNLAAVLENSGTLQSTWAGYESSEEAMMKALPQFTGMVLAADYSWSGRQEAVDKLGYDPAEVFRKMYFGLPMPVVPKAGLVFGNGQELMIEGVKYRLFEKPYSLATVLQPGNGSSAQSLSFTLTKPLAELCLCADSTTAGDDGDPVAELTVTYDTGAPTVRVLTYGRDVRSIVDHAMVPFAARANGYCSMRIFAPAGKRITGFSVRAISPISGFRIFGVTGVGNR